MNRRGSNAEIVGTGDGATAWTVNVGVARGSSVTTGIVAGGSVEVGIDAGGSATDGTASVGAIFGACVVATTVGVLTADVVVGAAGAAKLPDVCPLAPQDATAIDASAIAISRECTRS